MKAFILLPVILLFAGCLTPKEEPAPPSEEVHYVSSIPALADCNLKSTVEARETCYVDVAMAHNDPKLCDEAGSQRLRNLCYHRISKKLENPSLCFKIKNDDWRYTDCVAASSQ